MLVKSSKIGISDVTCFNIKTKEGTTSQPPEASHIQLGERKSHFITRVKATIAKQMAKNNLTFLVHLLDRATQACWPSARPSIA